MELGHFCYFLLLGSFIAQLSSSNSFLTKAVIECAGFLHPQVMVLVNHEGVQNF